VVNFVSFVSTTNTARSLANFLARISTDVVAVAGALGGVMSVLVGRDRSLVDLTVARPLKHSLVDEGGLWIRWARPVVPGSYSTNTSLTLLPGTFGNSCW